VYHPLNDFTEAVPSKLLSDSTLGLHHIENISTVNELHYIIDAVVVLAAIDLTDN
jgi:hypothetical protein